MKGLSALSLRYRLYKQLAKHRLSLLVVITAAVGYLVAASGSIQWWNLLWLTIGTYLAAASANTFNQCLEVERDARMKRTANRPLPSGRLSMTEALAFGSIAGILGLLSLGIFCNALTAGLALLNIVLYVGIYTPLKTRSSLNTVVGAVVGGIPPMMGWVAATGQVELGAWVLGALLFVWQIPHFLALAWLYREDYAKGGYQMLPAVDPEGVLTFRITVWYCAALIPVVIAATIFGLTGWIFAIGAVAAGVWMLVLGIRLSQSGDDGAARRLFYASLIYLPLVLGLAVVDAQRTDEGITPIFASNQVVETQHPPDGVFVSAERVKTEW